MGFCDYCGKQLAERDKDILTKGKALCEVCRYIDRRKEHCKECGKWIPAIDRSPYDLCNRCKGK